MKSGRYQNASEAVRDAVRGLQQRLQPDALRLDILRAQLRAGTDALEQGRFADVDETDLDAVLDALADEANRVA